MTMVDKFDGNLMLLDCWVRDWWMMGLLVIVVGSDSSISDGGW
jgi:hypothetical protein